MCDSQEGHIVCMQVHPVGGTAMRVDSELSIQVVCDGSYKVNNRKK
jgi:hypothetical protein